MKKLLFGLLFFTANSAFTAECDKIEKVAVAVAQKAIVSQLHSELGLTDQDKIEVELTKESTFYMANYHAGPRTFVDYAIRVEVHLQNGTILQGHRSKNDIGKAAFSFAHTDPKTCEFQAEWVDDPEIVEVTTGKMILDHEENFALSTNYWVERD
jgi:hypothetical protein